MGRWRIYTNTLTTGEVWTGTNADAARDFPHLTDVVRANRPVAP